MSTPQIKVLVVEDHPITRAGLALFLNAHADLLLLGEVASGEEAITFCEEQLPDVVLMDFKLPGMDGVSAMQAIRQNHPNVQVIILTSYPQPDYVERAMQTGAAGYLLKSAGAQELVDAIRAAHQGHTVLAQEAAEALVYAMRQQGSRDYELSTREREVLGLLVKGLSNAQIAERLTVSHATVKFHIGRILTKLGVSSRAEAISMAWQRHLSS